MRHKAIRAFRRAAHTLLLTTLAAAAALNPQIAGAQQKLKPEEVVAKHLESIGAAEARVSVRNRILQGEVLMTLVSPQKGHVGGLMVMASEGDRHLAGMSFQNVTNYPHDKWGFDGKDVSISYLGPGRRSPLGDFLQMNPAIVSHGLLGGTLSGAWPLLAGDAPGRKFKLEGGGLKKVGDRPAYALKYAARGVDIDITLFFDAETFRHVRTEYSRSVAAMMGVNPEASAGQRETRYRLVEEFSDFQKEHTLTLPHKYRILFEASLPGASYKSEWEAVIKQVHFNQNIDPKSFDVDDTAGGR